MRQSILRPAAVSLSQSNAHDGAARIAIRDNGMGIPGDMLAPIFEMFVQVTDTSSAAQGGLGIGLTLVKSLVELHGGTVRAYSAGAGAGSELVVTLPLLAASQISRCGCVAGADYAACPAIS